MFKFYRTRLGFVLRCFRFWSRCFFFGDGDGFLVGLGRLEGIVCVWAFGFFI